MAVLKQIWLFEIIGGYVAYVSNTTMRVYGAWIKIYCVYVPKQITPCTVVITPLLVRDKPLEAPASVKRVYWIHGGWCPCDAKSHSIGKFGSDFFWTLERLWFCAACPVVCMVEWLIRKSRDYVYWKCQYKLHSIKKAIWEEKWLEKLYV